MASNKAVVLGAGISGHTAALFLRKFLKRDVDVVVISPRGDFNWLPSNVWVGVGQMKRERVVFPLPPIYDRAGIVFHQAKATEIHPEGDAARGPFVVAESTAPGKDGERIEVEYDYLVNATGPKLNFGATPGLGPDGHTYSVCADDHAEKTGAAFLEAVERMKRGEKKRFLVGTGHGMCTCQGAAFEFTTNLEFELRAHGVRDKAEVVYLSNEYELGDFGLDGFHIRRNGYITPGKVFAESLFAERDIEWITRSHVNGVEPGVAHYENLDGEQRSVAFDFAMLLPPFSGVGLKAIDKAGADITDTVFAPNGFMKVDADYTPKPYEQWSPDDWPKTYRNPTYDNLFACGIAFAPPHAVSRPRKSANGTPISPTPPRTGMPSATIGKAVAKNIATLVAGRGGSLAPSSMADMGAACIASAGANVFRGTAASITVFPIIPDYDRYPEHGRDIRLTFGEVGLAGHWIKVILHYLFIYKAKRRPFWALIPE